MDCFLTGTDTNAGKTLVATGLLRALAGRGRRVAAMKPIVTGGEPGTADLHYEDLVRLRAAATVELPEEILSPCRYREPTAPHLAASYAGTAIEIPPILAAYRRARAVADHVVVEGIGGWALPLSTGTMLADLIKAMNLRVILVIGVRLGALNHALLSARAIVADGCRLHGWIATVVDPQYPYARDTVDSLATMIAAPCLGLVPWQPRPGADIIAKYLHRAADSLA